MTVEQQYDMVHEIVNGVMCELNVKQKLSILSQCVVTVINSPDEVVNSCANPGSSPAF